MDSCKIGKFIAELRKEKNVTQQQLADTLYVTRESVSKWERGVNTPEVPSLVIMSKFFNVSVNELIAGERLTKDNKEKIENVALNVLSFSKSKIDKIRKIALGIIFALVIIFLAIYFIYNYNSLKVYVISAEQNNNFDLSQGIIVTSKQKSYISLGNLLNKTDEEIDHVELYYEYKDDKRILMVTDNINSLTIDLNEYNEFVKVESISKILSHLYLDIITNKNIHRLPLKSHLDYSNSYIIPLMIKTNENKDEATPMVASNIPKFITNKFTYENDQYIYSFKSDGTIYNCSYSGLDKIIVKDASKDEFYMYEILNNEIVSLDGDTLEYSYKDNKCITGNCKKYKKLINSFEKFVLN